VYPLNVAPHPLLDLCAFVTSFPGPLGELPSPPALLAGLAPGYPDAPVHSDEHVRAAVRDLLRHGGIFKPTGRSEPASEYLLKAASEGMASINLAVDACNVASLHSGLPISVVDLDLVTPPLSIAVAPAGARARRRTLRRGSLDARWAGVYRRQSKPVPKDRPGGEARASRASRASRISR